MEYIKDEYGNPYNKSVKLVGQIKQGSLLKGNVLSSYIY